MDWEWQYVGIPFVERGRSREGADCWGLVKIILKEVFWVEAPDYLDEQYKFGATMVDERRQSEWSAVAEGEEQSGDVVLIRAYGAPSHVALVVDPARKTMIHTDRGFNACIDRYSSPKWIRRVIGFYRFEKAKAALDFSSTASSIIPHESG